MTIESGKTRASGQTAAAEEAKEAAEELDQPIEHDLPEDRPRSMHRTPAFSRMRTEWSREDHLVVQRAQVAVDARIQRAFAGAFEVMNEVYDIVREPEIDPATGEVVRDQWGWPRWKHNAYGGFVEDFTRLTTKEKEHLLFKITTRIFEWEQAAADAWGEAMLAKAAFEEQFAIGFDRSSKGTVDDRKAQGNIEAREERYFAIFVSTYSRKADSIVRSMTLLGQRLRDTLA